MRDEEERNPWTARIITAIVCALLVAGGVYFYAYRWAPSRHLQSLKDILETSPDAMVRANAAREVALAKDVSAAPLLLKALEDEDENVRSAAASGLGVLGAKSAVDGLVQALKDKNCRVRESAATALGLLKDASAVKPLIGALHDKEASVRRMAVFALGGIGDASAVSDLEKLSKSDASEDVRTAAEEAVVFLKTGKWPQAD